MAKQGEANKCVMDAWIILSVEALLGFGSLLTPSVLFSPSPFPAFVSSTLCPLPFQYAAFDTLRPGFDYITYLCFTRLCRDTMILVAPLALWLLIPSYTFGATPTSSSSPPSSASSSSLSGFSLAESYSEALSRIDTTSIKGLVTSINDTDWVSVASSYLQQMTIQNTKQGNEWLPVAFAWCLTCVGNGLLVVYWKKVSVWGNSNLCYILGF